jgi:hypothetical protein
MKNAMNAVIFGFKEILNWNTMLYALVSGFLITVVWVGIGIYFWDGLVSVSSNILELVPFSMVRSNGAWMLSTFLWLQAVLLTFALIFAFFGNIILRSVSKEKYTSFSLLVSGGSALFWAIVWYFKGDYIYQQFLKLLTWLPFETIEKGVAFLIGFYLIYNAIIVSLFFVASIFSEPLLSSIEKRHFNEDEVVRDHKFRVFGYTLKDSLIFVAVSIIGMPLLFIPVLNIIVQIALWIWLVKDTLTYDAAALSYEEVDKEALKEHKGSLWFISLIAALFNFIPVLNLFGPYFGEIAMFHYLKSVQKQP